MWNRRSRPPNGPAGPGDPLAVLEGVNRTFGEGPRQVVALRDLTLEIPRGEFVVFLGPSGSGKTTLLNIVGGLDLPTVGRVTIAGHDLTDLDEAGLTRYRRDVVGFVFQFFNLVPTLTARENVELVAGLVPEPEDVDETLEAVGLTGRDDHFPGALSGGEQQRVAIARALVKGPELLLADEPTGSLDFETGIRVLAVLQQTTRASGHGVMLVTHNQEIARMADRVVRLHSGRVAEVVVNTEPAPASELRW